MPFDLLSSIDPHKHYYQLHEKTVDDINHIIPLKKKIDEKSLFRYHYDDYLVHIFKYDIDIEFKKFFTINLDMIKEAKNKNLDMLFIFALNNDIYYWIYNENDITLGYRYTNNNKTPNLIFIFSESLTSINKFTYP